MKPSEKRALREERLRREQEEAENTAPVEEKAFSAGTDEHGEYTPYRRKEGFFQSHARLITFIITTALILTVFGPVGIDMLVARRNDHTVNSKKDMTLEDVYSLYDNSSKLKWSSLSEYNYADYSYDTKNGRYLVREYRIKDSRLVLKVGGPKSKSRPDYVRLTDYILVKFVDILKEDPREFVRITEQETEK